MAFHRLMLMALLAAWTTVAFGQGLNTDAKKTDWEEINFAFDSSVLTDGYPSLLRLAELLKANTGYRVELVGNADYIGSDAYNRRLGLARANTVRDFLVKYGANANQITTSSGGENNPKVNARSREARWMNRRVYVTPRDAQGNAIGVPEGGGVNDTIKALEALTKKQQECCDEILKKLDALDDIVAMLRDLKAENQRLKGEVDTLKEAQSDLRRDLTNELAGMPGKMETAARTASEESIRDAEERARSRRFSVLGLNVGPDFTHGYRGNITFSGKGRYFIPFNRSSAFQAEGEYMYYKSRQEGQADFGLVHRVGSLQAGGFASFKHVRFPEYQSGANLSQASFTLDSIFRGGRLGAYGTKSLGSEAVVNRLELNPRIFEEIYVQSLDQLGFSWSLAAPLQAAFEGNAGAIFRRLGDDKFGFTMRYVQPLPGYPFAFTAEGSMNETLVGFGGNNGRLTFGLQFGRWMNPRSYARSDHAVPADIPRVRYELGVRTTREGNSPPIADAGADQAGVRAGTITLDGRASYDPEGDPITFRWQQLGGPAVSLSGQNTSVATFAAANDATYSFVLSVRDDKGAESRARVTVSTESQTGNRARIFRFQAVPMTIRPGQATTLSWETENADRVTIDGIGNVATSGATTVSPSQTTTYRLTASNRSGEQSSTITVQVNPGNAPRILRFALAPTEIGAGETATLEWNVEDATSVNISGIGTVQVAGSRSVSPAQTTTYTLTATNQSGTVTATVVLTVIRPVKVLNFAASPTSIKNPGDPATLSWQTEGADEVIITGIGAVAKSGSITVNPAATTSYSLIARGGRESVTAVTTVTLEGAPGGGPGGGPPIANAGPDFSTGSATVKLDASQSQSRIGGALKYSWRLIGAGQFRLADINPPNSATPTVVLKSGIGKYIFEVTVEDSQGGKNTDTVTVDYNF